MILLLFSVAANNAARNAKVAIKVLATCLAMEEADLAGQLKMARKPKPV